MCVFKLADLYSEFVYLRHTFQTLFSSPFKPLTHPLSKPYFFSAYISHIKCALPWYAPVFRADAVAVQPNKNLGRIRYVNLRFFVHKILYHDQLFFVLGFWGLEEIRGIFRRHILSFFFVKITIFTMTFPSETYLLLTVCFLSFTISETIESMISYSM